MKPAISIALITLGLTFPAPAMAVDYVQCEAMKRRFYADTQEQKERADQARMDDWRRTAPPAKPHPTMTTAECLDAPNFDCLNLFRHAERIPSPGTQRWKEGERIYAEVVLQPTEHTRRIVDDMHAAGCF